MKMQIKTTRRYYLQGPKMIKIKRQILTSVGEDKRD